MIEWKKIRNGCSFISGFAFKGSDFNEIGDGVPIIKIKNIQNDFVTLEKSQFISIKNLEKYNSLKKFRTEKNEILIAMTGAGSVGRVGLTNFNGVALLNQRVGKFDVDEINLNKEYLFNVLTSKYFKKLLFDKGQGSGQPNLSANDILEVKIPFPPYQEQIEIGKTLQLLIEKILLLQAQNKTLENIAQTIFKEWFGKYKIGDELPEGWRVGKLGKFAIVKSGYAFKSKDFVASENTKALKIKDLKGKGVVSLTEISSISENVTNSDRVQYFKLNSGDIVLAMSGNTTGKIGVIPPHAIEVYLNQRVGKFFFKEKKLRTYIFNFLMSGGFEDKILNMSYGSAQPNISPSQIEDIDVVIPSNEGLNKFLNISIPIFNKVLKNYSQIQTLTQTRDALLPKLMKGELRINDFKANTV